MHTISRAMVRSDREMLSGLDEVVGRVIGGFHLERSGIGSLTAGSCG